MHSTCTPAFIALYPSLIATLYSYMAKNKNRHTTYLRRFFQDKSGNIVVGQRPNIFISLWAIGSIAQLTIFKNATWLSFITTGTLLIWAGLEITSGASPFRRVMGAVVAVVAVTGIIR